MPAETGQILGAISAVVGAVVWLIRLEGRVNLHERLHGQLREDVTYIRNRIDAALNGKHD